ncbi:MAG: PD40 domain-containing protein [Bacteroidetes bacterium]|nr:PD40 domain-containing protein [Bacteroidota bacterium]
MKIRTRFIEKFINAGMVVSVMLFSGLYSCVAQAQSLPTSYLHPISLAKNTTKKIKLSQKVRLESKATALHGSINGPYAEMKPSVAPGGKRLYFSRADHPDNTFGTADLEDIWYAELDSSNNWTDPVRLPGALNNAGPNFIDNVSKSGDTIILGNEYLKKGRMRDGLSYSVNIDGQWSQPMPIRIENHYNISNQSHAFVSLQKGIIILAIQRTESMGDRDLYVSFWDGTKATEPVNMGSAINTEFEESSPYLAADNRTLYFASKGHNGYGGLDIFVTRRLDDTWTNWSEPENLGPAVNGELDEEHFNITHCGKRAVFAKQISVHNIDLYTIGMDELFIKKTFGEGDDDIEGDEVKATFR